MGNVIVWADIPVTDMERARKFYAHVSGVEVLQFPGMTDVAVIGKPGTAENPSVSADLYLGGKPSSEGGVTIYLGSNGDIDGMVARVVEAGGKILQEKAFMGDTVGWIAMFQDSEGNRIGIQQPG